MQVIHKADETIALLWGQGKIKPIAYRLLTYVISVDVVGGMLLHNAVTGELIFLDADETQQLLKLPCAYAPWMDELIRKRFLVKCDADDEATVDTLREAYNASCCIGRITHYTVLPTTNCNARCFYCYECGIRHENMSDETADRLVRFMEEYRGNDSLEISWFGGEPLLGIRQIDRICSALKAKSIPFSSSIISNGYLFTEETANRAANAWNLQWAQITLDGTEKVYNETKAYVAPCENPYRRVLDNIGLLLDNGISVVIRLNLGTHNADDLMMLVEELAKRFVDKKNLNIYVHLLFEDCGVAPQRLGADDKTLLEQKKEELDALICKLNFAPSKKKLPLLITNHCMADSPLFLVVSPSGKLSKCEHFVERRFVGDLEAGITNRDEVRLFRERVLLSECHGCPLYPSCIKLNLCAPEEECTVSRFASKLKEAKRNMKAYYGEFLRDNKNTTDMEVKPFC